MRTIKFRAQDIASNKWLYGDIRYHKNDVCIFEQGGNRGEQVKPETIGQFTGLTDKNGKEIYEGDIVRNTNSNEFVYEVVYDGKRFASFGLRRKQDAFMHYFGEAIEADECEVDGNIHDNPEILEKGGKK